GAARAPAGRGSRVRRSVTSGRPLRVGDRVLVRHTTMTVKALVHDLGGATELHANDLSRATLRTAEPLALDDCAVSRRTGAFVLIDPADGATLTAGMVSTVSMGDLNFPG
ncbi:hypothetical protein ABZZ80_17495, partial [Streptomyces sp. NPDC006356]